MKEFLAIVISLILIGSATGAGIITFSGGVSANSIQDQQNNIEWESAPPENVTRKGSFSVTVTGTAEDSGTVCVYSYQSRGGSAQTGPYQTSKKCQDVSAGKFEKTFNYDSLIKLTLTKKIILLWRETIRSNSERN